MLPRHRAELEHMRPSAAAGQPCQARAWWAGLGHPALPSLTSAGKKALGRVNYSPFYLFHFVPFSATASVARKPTAGGNGIHY